MEGYILFKYCMIFIVKCFENWENKQYVPLLQEIKPPRFTEISRLENYRDNVIKYILEDASNVTMD